MHQSAPLPLSPSPLLYFGTEVRIQVQGADSLSVNGHTAQLKTAIGQANLPLLEVVGADGAPLSLFPATSPGVNGKEISAPFAPPSTASVPPAITGRVTGLASPLLTGKSIPLAQTVNSEILAYSTYLGGSSSDISYDIAVDDDGHAYVVGFTSSTDFPVVPGEGYPIANAFVVKLNAAGTALDNVILLGSDRENMATSVAVDAAGNLYVAGHTDDTYFPVTSGAYQESHSGGGTTDFFVTVLQPNSGGGYDIAYSTFVGGQYDELQPRIALRQGVNHIYLTGTNWGGDFPTTGNAADSTFNGIRDVVVVTLDPAGNGANDLIYATYWGGSDSDFGIGIVADEVGQIYVTGETRSTDLTVTPNAFSTGYTGTTNYGFLLKLTSAGSIDYFTHLEGYGGDVAIDNDGYVYVAGTATSSSFPTTAGAYDTVYNPSGETDAFVIKLNLAGTGLNDLLYGTFLGGSNDECFYGKCNLELDAMGNIYVAGETVSDDFPLTDDAVDPVNPTGYYSADAFLVKLKPTGQGANDLLYSTYLGGHAGYWVECNGWPCRVALDTTGDAYISGITQSPDFPVTSNAFDTSYNDLVDVFITKLALGSSSPLPTDQTLAQECPVCSSKEKQNTIGDPINTYSGNFNHEATDISIPTLSLPLSFERSYNSLTTLTDTIIYSQSLGYGWTHNYNLNLTLPDDPDGEADTVILKAPHGSRMRFTDNGDGTYSAAPGVWATLNRRGSAAPYTYVITAANQTVYSFGILTDTIAVSPIAATPALSLTLTPDYAVGVAPGKVFNLTFSLANNSNITDTYTLAATDSWVGLNPPTATLAGGAAITVTATFTAPTGYGRDAAVATSIRATSQTSPTLTATAVETLTLRGYRLLTLQDPQGNLTTFDYDSRGYLGMAGDPTDQRYLDFTHDPQGRLTVITDHTGRSVEYGYDDLDNLTVVTDTRGLEWTYVYTSAGTGSHLLHQIIDPDGRTVEKTFFDDQGRATRQLDGEGRTMAEIAYSTVGGNEIRVVTEAGKVYTDTYNARGLLENQVDSLGNETSHDFDDAFNRNYSEDGNGNATIYTRTPLGQTTAITDAQGNVTTFEYDDRNNLTRSVDARGTETTYAYDTRNNIISTTNHLGHSTRYTYNANGRQTSVTDENGHTTRYGYDAIGQRTVITDALGNVTRYEYDAVGRLVRTVDALGKVTLNEYDGGDNLVKVTENYLAGQPQNYQNEYNLVTEYTYDGAGRRVTTTDTLGRVSRSVYDDAGRLLRSIQNEHPTETAQNYQNEYNLITEYVYDAAGNQVATIDTLGRETRTEYDALNRVERTIVNYVDGSYNPAAPDEDIITEFGYDANGNLLETIDVLRSAPNGVGRRTRTEYDSLNRVSRTIVNYKDGVYSAANPDEDLITAYTYDEVGNQQTITDPLDRVTTYSYDDLNRAESITNPANGTTRYSYDPAGNRRSVTDAANETTEFEYDALNRLILTRDPLGNETEHRYDAAGNRTALIDAEGIETRYRYDSLYRLSRLTENYVDGVYAAGVTDEDVTTQYQYDPVGNRIKTIDARGNETGYTYDTLNRRIQMTDPESNTTQYGYDALSNRTTMTDPNGIITSFGYDNLNRLTGIDYADSTPDVTFTYDGEAAV